MEFCARGQEAEVAAAGVGRDIEGRCWEDLGVGIAQCAPDRAADGFGWTEESLPAHAAMKSLVVKRWRCTKCPASGCFAAPESLVSPPPR